jgi:hypothetical protein
LFELHSIINCETSDPVNIFSIKDSSDSANIIKPKLFVDLNVKIRLERLAFSAVVLKTNATPGQLF